jgi:hypothetical protein
MKQIQKRPGAVFKAPFGIAMLTLAGLVLTACDQADAARPPICRDATITVAVTDAAARLRRAEDESRRIAMGGNGFAGAKVGPVPGMELDAALQRAAAEVTDARRALLAVRRHCMTE